MSLNDSLFGEESKRWEEYWLILQEQKRQEQNNEEQNNKTRHSAHKQSA